jgi:hypothetical protein
MSQASGVLIYSVANRGNGSPVLNTDGNVSVVSGWQGDVRPRENAQTIVPIAKNPGGTPVTGLITARFINAPKVATTLPLGSAVSAIVYQLPATLDTKKAVLTKRASL